MKLQLILILILSSLFANAQQKEGVRFDPYKSIYKKRIAGEKKHILYIGGGDFHDDLRRASEIRKFLEIENNYFVTYTEDYEVFVNRLSNYDVLLINTTINNLSQEQYKGILKAVKEGMPVLGIHSATASFRSTKIGDWSEFYKMIGARFDHHPKMHTYTINLFQKNELLNSSFANYEVYEELYFYTHLNPKNKILLTANYKGKVSPVAWVKKYGEGKVFYTALGHSLAVSKDKNFQKLILFALEWLTEKTSNNTKKLKL